MNYEFHYKKKRNNPNKNGQRIWIDIFPKKTSGWPTDNVKICSTSLIVREMQIKTSMRYHLTLVRTTITKKTTNNNCWQGCVECCWWDCKLVQPLWKTVWRPLKSYDPTIPLLGIYPKKTKILIWKDICTLVFTAALFTIAKMWKWPKCPLIDKCIKKMWYTYTMECYLAIKKRKKSASSDNMDDSRGYHAKWNKSDRERQILYDLTYIWNPKNKTKKTKWKQTHRYRAQMGVCLRGGRWEDGWNR